MNETAELDTKTAAQAAEELPEPLTHGVEAYISEDYARAERDKLWRKVWLQAGRLEDIPEVGNYITYEILDDSILLVRTAPETVKAYYNVCSHRGRRLDRYAEGRPQRERQADEVRLRLSLLDLQPGGPVHLHPGEG